MSLKHFLKTCLLLYFLCAPSFPFLILGPLSKKQNDDLADNDGAEDEGIFFDAKLLCMTRNPPVFFLFVFLKFLVLFESGDFFFLARFLLDVFCRFGLM